MIKYEVTVNDEGTEYWYLNDKLHREDGPAIKYTDGSESWYLNDKLHRVDGPAVTYADGYEAWWLNDKLHREDGSAIKCTNGSEEWWLNGCKVTKEDVMGHTITIDGKPVSISKESYLKLKETIK